MFKAFSQNKRLRRSAAFLLLYDVSNCFYLHHALAFGAVSCDNKVKYD